MVTWWLLVDVGEAGTRHHLVVLGLEARQVLQPLTVLRRPLLVQRQRLQCVRFVLLQLLLQLQFVPQNLTLMQLHILEADAHLIGVIHLLFDLVHSDLVFQHVPQILPRLLVLHLEKTLRLSRNGLQSIFDQHLLLLAAEAAQTAAVRRLPGQHHPVSIA